MNQEEKEQDKKLELIQLVTETAGLLSEARLNRLITLIKDIKLVLEVEKAA